MIRWFLLQDKNGNTARINIHSKTCEPYCPNGEDINNFYQEDLDRIQRSVMDTTMRPEPERPKLRFPRGSRR